MNFLERIFDALQREPGRTLLQEAWPERLESATAGELLQRVAQARTFLRGAGSKPGDRCVLLAANGIRWAALDLAIMAEGLVRVPLYTRQSPAELVPMMQDCGASLVLCGDEALRGALREHGAGVPAHVFDTVFASPTTVAVDTPPLPRSSADPLAIIYTSGTSGVAKGVVLTVGNLDHMLPCTLQRLDELMQGHSGQERVFHYLPFNFAGSWILLLTSLTRRSLLTLATDLETLPSQLRLAAPHYFQNVPLLLERIRSGIDAKLRGPVTRSLYERARATWTRRQSGRPAAFDGFWFGLARSLLFQRVRQKISPNLRALICGSAPLSEDTQTFFEMLGIPVLQVYGLTETTAICTMDAPRGLRKPGRVGSAVSGIEMKLGDQDEILVRGPHVFAGYWNRPDETAACMQDGWFRTGDQGEVDANGLWRIVGRIKNLIVLTSGHKLAPDPLEERLRQEIPGAQQVVLVGHERKHLTTIVTGNVTSQDIEAALDRLNPTLPHYKQVHGFHIQRRPFTTEDGLLTANGKLKRQKVLDALAPEIDALYRDHGHAASGKSHATSGKST